MENEYKNKIGLFYINLHKTLELNCNPKSRLIDMEIVGEVIGFYRFSKELRRVFLCELERLGLVKRHGRGEYLYVFKSKLSKHVRSFSSMYRYIGVA